MMDVFSDMAIRPSIPTNNAPSGISDLEEEAETPVCSLPFRLPIFSKRVRFEFPTRKCEVFTERNQVVPDSAIFKSCDFLPVVLPDMVGATRVLLSVVSVSRYPNGDNCRDIMIACMGAKRGCGHAHTTS